MPFALRQGRWLVRGIDWLVRRFRGIIEFDTNVDGLISIAFIRAEEALRLSDGTTLSPGDRVVELHLSNERLLRIPAGGADLGRAIALRRGVLQSLRRLAALMPADRRFDAVKALRIEPALAGARAASVLSRIMAKYDFTPAPGERGAPAGSWIFRVVDNLWMSLLAWTFNPADSKRWRVDRRRRTYWISRTGFLARFGGGGGDS
jgi:hypothetical protein